MIQPTKQELKDRIAELEKQNNWLEVKLLAANDFKEQFKAQAYKHRDRGKRATIAAYACLAVIFIMVGCEVIW